MTKQERDESLEKSIDTFIDDFLATQDDEDNTQEGVKKANDIDSKFDSIKSDEDAKKERPTEALGGNDIIKAEKEDDKKDEKEDDKEMEKKMKKADKEDDKEDEKEEGKKELEKKMKKSYELTSEDYELLQKAKREQDDRLQKAKKDESEAFTKSIVDRAVQPLVKQIEELTKSLARPAGVRKSITKVEAIQKSFNTHNDQGGKQLSKAQRLDLAEDLALKGKINPNSVIELEGTGVMSDRRDFEVFQKSMNEVE